MRFCYGPPDQEVDEAFYRQLEVASQSQVLVLLGVLPAGKTTELGTNSPEGAFRVLMVTFGEMSEERCTAGPCTDKQRRAAWRCVGWGQPWMQ